MKPSVFQVCNPYSSDGRVLQFYLYHASTGLQNSTDPLTRPFKIKAALQTGSCISSSLDGISLVSTLTQRCATKGAKGLRRLLHNHRSCQITAKYQRGGKPKCCPLFLFSFLLFLLDVLSLFMLLCDDENPIDSRIFFPEDRGQNKGPEKTVVMLTTYVRKRREETKDKKKKKNSLALQFAGTATKITIDTLRNYAHVHTTVYTYYTFQGRVEEKTRI